MVQAETFDLHGKNPYTLASVLKKNSQVHILHLNPHTCTSLHPF